MEIVVRRATIEDLDASAAVLGRAFGDYPWTRWTVDGDDHVRRVTGLQRLALATYGLPFGQVWLAEADGAVASVAVWMDSAVEITPDVHDSIAEATAALAGSRASAAADADAQVEGWRPQGRHLYLATVGTDPAMRRNGLAERVIGPMLVAADTEGIAAHLETSSASNVAFYERLGFSVTHRYVIADGGPDVWCMLREPS